MAEVIVVHPENPQERNIHRIAELLRDGAVAVLPTDSGYALGCVLENKEARERIIRIRNVDKNHNFTLLCADLSELSTYSKVDNTAFRLIRNNTPGPYTFILKGTKEVPKKLMNEKRKTIGLRVPENNIIAELLRYMGEPLMSVSLILPESDKAENDPYEIDDKIGKLVDVIVDGGYLVEQPTTVINLSEEGSVEVVRVGSGDPTPFQ
ncbi:MAG: threonylcarbamoyl-AMP synthase [Ruminobacter sp.]|jgi:tRNA threonylcarbamoyl adenosine modification protein (Sua5/YciO/YrdC/YwlC family)|uniref:tRNA threonylcarbamoyl adenosine modification protein, Sua5/YciO/YrdC/YwlC family n=1 Tax=Ruminobacter amylophilus TaxID=867 RepID=A0A662ZG09_9GAMM|nr:MULTISPECIES: L-threonylcarbamoyladenylate synthase [Ruminobacter]MBQ3774838.1 threonylcarbamoyl-AMP synthase [Ruminobacter sp.]SFP22429.1 tRNA threonylcarbamoyl adenosine modification protein, Sua5/YciO/YrdC/YwlC family [Ruminobacter amylophilus]